MRYFTVVMGLIIILTFLLAVTLGAVRAADGPPAAHQAESGQGDLVICLGLVGGSALLASLTWFRTLQRIPR